MAYWNAGERRVCEVMSLHPEPTMPTKACHLNGTRPNDGQIQWPTEEIEILKLVSRCSVSVKLIQRDVSSLQVRTKHLTFTKPVTK